MKKRFSIRLLSYLIILILVLSAPLAAYAEEVTPVPAEEEADGTPLSPVRTTNCGYHDDFENTEDAAESIFEAFVPAADLNDQN